MSDIVTINRMLVNLVLLSALSLTMASATLASERNLTVQTLADICSDKQQGSVKRAHCVGFIAGVLDAYQSLRQLGSIEGPLCLPTEGIQPKDAINVFLAWVTAHPELASRSAATGVLLSMKERHPC